MDEALRMVPGFRTTQYSDINMQNQQAGIEEGYQMRGITDSVNRFNFAQQEKENKSDRLGSRVANNLGFGVQTETQTIPPGQIFGQVLGGVGGLMGGIGGMATGFGWGG